MERPRPNRRWNTAQLLKSIEESQFGAEERRHAPEPSSNTHTNRSFVSRLGMSELSCFPSSRSRRAAELHQDEPRAARRPAALQRRIIGSSSGSASQLRSESRRAGGAPPSSSRVRMFPRSRTNPLEQQRESTHEAFDLEEQVFELAMVSDPPGRQHAYRNPTETSLRSSICKRKSFARGASSEKKLREEHQRAANLRRSSSSVARGSSSSSSLASSIDGLRPQKLRASRRAPELGSSSRVSGESYQGLMSEQQSSSFRARRGEEASWRGSRNVASSSRSRLAGAPSSSSSSARSTSNRSFSREVSGFSRRNISNCFPALASQGRRSSSTAASPPSSSPPETLSQEIGFSSGASSSRQAPDPSSELTWPSSSSSTSLEWDYHRPRFMAEGLAKILMALERVESDDDLTHEQLLMLEASVLFGGMGYRDHHQAWRMDVDTMSYEELLELGDKIGTVNTGLDQQTISSKLYKSNYTVKNIKTRPSRSKEEHDIKCSVCQEEYEKNEQLGWLDCGHQFHAECIRQWLVLKNICPICKATALSK